MFNTKRKTVELGYDMKTYILLTSKSWHNDLFKRLSDDFTVQWIRITNKEDFTYDKLMEISPDSIFIPHWSDKIPVEIFSNFSCILFHITDLPFGSRRYFNQFLFNFGSCLFHHGVKMIRPHKT